jgi:hypothetical protein
MNADLGRGGAPALGLRQLSEHLFAAEDTCNVYPLRDGDAGLLIDAGSGAVGELLGEAADVVHALAALQARGGACVRD